MFQNKAGKRFADDQANIQRQAGIFHPFSAGAINDSYMVRIFQDYVSGLFKGNYLLKMVQMDFFVNADQLAGRIQRQDLAMIPGCKSTARFYFFVRFSEFP